MRRNRNGNVGWCSKRTIDIPNDVFPEDSFFLLREKSLNGTGAVSKLLSSVSIRLTDVQYRKGQEVVRVEVEGDEGLSFENLPAHNSHRQWFNLAGSDFQMGSFFGYSDSLLLKLGVHVGDEVQGNGLRFGVCRSTFPVLFVRSHTLGRVSKSLLDARVQTDWTYDRLKEALKGVDFEDWHELIPDGRGFKICKWEGGDLKEKKSWSRPR